MSSSSALRTLFSDALKDALKAREARKVSTLRLILAALKDRDIAARTESNREGVGDDDILALLQKMIKQRDEAIETYETAGRIDLAEQEREERAIISSYLPKQMNADEARSAISELISELGAKGLRDMGRTMNELKSRFAGKMDFGKASAMVKELLTA
ncbi:MAG TPA: GatB/YqeY domain-containing protein [Micropepsaceae bacterium]|nr:GatB/YqeY domain-containing protein [Micropepsaceae bacterium]HRK70867.1 GatB/YqeY domain-containing protein [Micropepsaceae bacterium]